ncbi:hypothetical protein RR48_14685 [Papilio machaon]|uniref:Uncharacterized protein n=1 Tax=Papilio machaon TaxID=76193 RepID=A0A194QKZ2_PAPMA|nr:hypothetical protein RR48_14685 [Papilio machaon]
MYGGTSVRTHAVTTIEEYILRKVSVPHEDSFEVAVSRAWEQRGVLFYKLCGGGGGGGGPGASTHSLQIYSTPEHLSKYPLNNLTPLSKVHSRIHNAFESLYRIPPTGSEPKLVVTRSATVVLNWAHNVVVKCDFARNEKGSSTQMHIRNTIGAADALRAFAKDVCSLLEGPYFVAWKYCRRQTITRRGRTRQEVMGAAADCQT